MQHQHQSAGTTPPSLHAFLSPYRVEKGHEHTHTSLGRQAGAFYLPSSSHAAFLTTYKAALERGEDLHLTERHRHVGPIVVDLDFRFEPTDEEVAALTAAQTPAETASEDVALAISATQQQLSTVPGRRHTPTLDEVVRAYARATSDLFQTPDEFEVYVTEKRAPTLLKGLLKDGAHLCIPAIVTRTAMQLLLRRDVMPSLAEAFRTLGLANRLEDVVDEAVIERNNWMMYGSKKNNCEAYKVTRRYVYCVSTGVSTPKPLVGGGGADAREFVDLFSIRNKFDDLPVREAHRERSDAFLAKLEEDRRRRESVQRMLTTEPNVRTNTCEDLDLVGKLAGLLDDARVETYNDWVRLGWCLRNIDHRLLDAWVDISKRSDKYVEGECPRLWHSMRSGGLGIGTLHMWARSDSPARYRELLRTDLVGLIKGSTTATQYDVARVVHHLYRYEFACCSLRNRTWYEFKGHRWHECDSGYALRRRLSIDVFEEYQKVIGLVAQRAHAFPALHQHINGEDGGGGAGSQVQRDQVREEVHKSCAEQIKKLTELALKLKVTKFKDDVMKECAELFYKERFEDKLDSDINLLGFENGVYDLEQHEFREGRPEDNVSFTTGINYIPYVPDHPTVRDVCRFWESVHPCTRIREYVLMTLASCLSGVQREERFHIWTGSGCHAAGTRVMLADGDTKAVENVDVGDRLLGDDGNSSRRVLALCRGRGDMYRIVPSVGAGGLGASGAGGEGLRQSFVVNGEHVLSLRACETVAIRPLASGSSSCAAPQCGQALEWLETTTDARNFDLNGGKGSVLWRQRRAVFPSFSDAVVAHSKMVAEGIAPSPPEPGWKLLVDGDVVDTTVRDYLTHVAAVGGLDRHLRLYRPGAVTYAARGTTDTTPPMTIEAACEAGRSAARSMRDGPSMLLPEAAVLAPDVDTRRALLATFLQTAAFGVGKRHGSVSQTCAIAVRPLALAGQVLRVARSLGLDCHPGRRLQGQFVTVEFGQTPQEFLERTLDIKTPMTPDAPARPHWLAQKFAVSKLDDDDFYGFELDGNHRYLMADFVATHNSNGKSLTVSLFEKSLGQYCCKFPVTLLTQKRAASSSATPEIARAKGRRFAVLQEPSEDERLNVGLLKELSGGDTVQTRELFKAPVEWRPQFKLFLLCNQLPNVPSDDGGTWRRIRVVEFGSKFVTTPSPERPNEFPIDMELSAKIEGWREHFMAMLIHYHRRYVSSPLEEPDDVVRSTREYQRTNDHMADFVDSCIEKVAAEEQVAGAGAFLALDDAISEFREWVKVEQVKNAKPGKAVLQKYLDRTLVRSSQLKGRVGYRGFRVRDRFAPLGNGDEAPQENEA